MFGGGMFGGGSRGGGGMRLIIGVVIVLIGIVTYFMKTSVNPATGEKQRVSLSPQQETALGLQAAPQMAQQMGGEVPQNHPDSQTVERLGQFLVSRSVASKSPYRYDFHLLADDRTVNAFALPGGQVFITRALYDKLEDEAMLAGVLGHEIAHVVHRHSAEHMAKGQLGQMIVTGVAVGASDSQGGSSAAMIAQMVNQMTQLKFSRSDESESDALGLRVMTESGFDPRAMIEVMKVLKEAGGGRGGQPEFLATHPDPGNRIEAIERWLREHPDEAKDMVRGRKLR